MLKSFSAKEFPCKILKDNGCKSIVYPFLRDDNGDKTMYSIGPLHGRSFLVGKSNRRFVVSKGNGLGYTGHSFLLTGEMSNLGDDTWGLLLKQDALRDFNVGLDVASLGIKTNRMEYVVELDTNVTLPNGHILKPTLLQYSVECPYRICDVAFMDKPTLVKEVEKWEQYNTKHYHSKHLVAADVMVKNLRSMHDNGILHNAIHEQNYTWALELLDFELARSPQHPYEKSDYERHVEDLLPREIIQTYVIINYIAWSLKEDIDYKKVDEIFTEYGYNLHNYEIAFKQ